MFQRLVLGLMLLVSGFVAGWLVREHLANQDCVAAGGQWVPPGICTGAR